MAFQVYIYILNYDELWLLKTFATVEFTAEASLEQAAEELDSVVMEQLLEQVIRPVCRQLPKENMMKTMETQTYGDHEKSETPRLIGFTWIHSCVIGGAKYVIRTISSTLADLITRKCWRVTSCAHC